MLVSILYIMSGERQFERVHCIEELREAGANITVMLQSDMLGYRAPGEPAQLGLPDKCALLLAFHLPSNANKVSGSRIGTPEVAQLIWNTANIYSPELKVGYTPACCSDHQVRGIGPSPQ